jgi:hypothetical protein
VPADPHQWAGGRPDCGISSAILTQIRTMPVHKRLWPDNRHGLKDRWKPAIHLDQEQAIAVGELDAAAHLTLQHDQLLSERSFLSLKLAPGF